MFFFSLFCGGSKYTQLNWAFCHQFKTSDERINGNSKTETENGNYQKGISGNLRLSKKKILWESRLSESYHLSLIDKSSSEYESVLINKLYRLRLLV